MNIEYKIEGLVCTMLLTMNLKYRKWINTLGWMYVLCILGSILLFGFMFPSCQSFVIAAKTENLREIVMFWKCYMSDVLFLEHENTHFRVR